MEPSSKQSTDTSLFNIGSELEQRLLLPSSGGDGEDAASSVFVTPLPGFCVKTRTTDTQEKVFLNVCTSDQVGKPKDISAAELQRVIDEQDVGSFRVPMSLGPPHTELDKSGKACTAYDVIVHPSFCAKVQAEEAFFGFLISACFHGLEEKHGVRLCSDSCVVLKNRRHFGTLEGQLVRKRARPFVVEMESAEREGETSTPAAKKGKLVEEISRAGTSERSAPVPKYTVVVEPREGKPEFTVVEVSLPGVNSARTLMLDVGEDRLVLVAHPAKYRLELDLPFWVYPEQGGSQFNKKTQTLCVTLPVQEGEERE